MVLCDHSTWYMYKLGNLHKIKKILEKKMNELIKQLVARTHALKLLLHL